MQTISASCNHDHCFCGRQHSTGSEAHASPLQCICMSENTESRQKGAILRILLSVVQVDNDAVHLQVVFGRLDRIRVLAVDHTGISDLTAVIMLIDHADIRLSIHICFVKRQVYKKWIVQATGSTSVHKVCQAKLSATLKYICKAPEFLKELKQGRRCTTWQARCSTYRLLYKGLTCPWRCQAPPLRQGTFKSARHSTNWESAA